MQSPTSQLHALGDLARTIRIAVHSEITVRVIHELTQPLAAIIANCDASLRWQRMGSPNLEEIRLASERARRDALRASAVLERMRASISAAVPNGAPVRAPDIAQQTLQMLASDLRAHQIDTDMVMPADLPLLCCSGIELQQVLTNLFTISIESLALLEAGAPRRLSVECVRRLVNGVDALVISIEHSGSLLAVEDAGPLFEELCATNADDTRMRLALSRSIIRRNGGEIRAIRSQTGPRFEFYIPFLEASA